MSFDLCIQSSIAKKQMLICLICSVGFCDATMSMVGLLSSYIRVGSVCLNSSSGKIDHIYFAVFAAITVAINSASVELREVRECVFDQYTTVPPE